MVLLVLGLELLEEVDQRLRASVYNAMPIEGAQALVEFLKKFEAEHTK